MDVDGGVAHADAVGGIPDGHSAQEARALLRANDLGAVSTSKIISFHTIATPFAEVNIFD